MNGYVAGLDGGGTKTAVAVAGPDGNLLFEFNTGAINYNGESAGNVRNNIKKILEELRLRCGSLENCLGICIGAAGVSNPAAREGLETSVRSCGYSGKLVITGDDKTALFGAMGKLCGMILIAGTGSICYGCNELGREHRTGGFGHLIDDRGSGYAIGREILSAVVRASDGRSEETALAGMVFGQLHISTIPELVRFVYDRETNKRDIAGLAPNLAAACELNDPVAMRIAEQCGSDLAEMVKPVADRLGLAEGEIATAGSILLQDLHVRTVFLSRMKTEYPGMSCIYPRQGAAYGAVLYMLDRL